MTVSGPAATVLASQTIVLLILLVALLQDHNAYALFFRF